MLNGMLQKAVALNPAKAAIVQGARRIRYDELDALARQCAGGLRRLGVEAGNCVAMALPNCPEFVAGLFACAKLHAVMLPLNPQYTREELLRIVADARPKVMITNSPGAKLPAGTGANITRFEELLTHPDEPLPTGPFRGPAVYLYTSG